MEDRGGTLGGLVRKYGDFSLACSLAQPRLRFYGDEHGGLCYDEHKSYGSSTRLVLGEPLADVECWERILIEFLNQSEDVIFLNVGEVFAKVLKAHGFYTNCIGWEALVDLTTYELAGPKKQNIRNAIRRCETNGYSIEEVDPASGAWLEVDSVSQDWLSRKSLSRPENRLITQPLLRANMGQRVFAMRDSRSEMVHFITIDEMWKDGALLGYHSNINRGVATSPKNADYAIHAHIIAQLKREKVDLFSLGLCPDMGSMRDGKSENIYLAIALLAGAKLGSHIYNLSGISAHKAAFRPDMKRSVFVATSRPWPIPSLARTLSAMNLI
ncbi:lysylphosphatidylglycerol synthetase-like protein (DUF2156 family) [Bradyrhizobium sp. USDA 4524]|uniref:DUF2156 domain-containing protein n=1 Tax=unclassified Bradyrhizobium TaxID=2631580 RepID=UPI00209CDE16|nr:MULTISPECIES: DUF2156 domain-containing protein [unclassified Bradyrhizobium]MCP1845979.1 lysylphosphatidylglycerol synthetase-like protein (DUF2156 family) [Bradyrhizobium sp. USDA 4538]MCP1907387.1 lysylphosphatidylglycerol synthetase-like protein (DUF2156 family) [Bradyrhizobium sp. USDA 4537]MCP1985173.1 lysylphosphatidylglycerol synthetase-like protein (DUF2156 family) [Bradyrhizobium sp. USDA 4539]